jgi:hypothetical protein
MTSPTPVPSTSTSPITRAITSPTDVRCSSSAGQPSTPRSASARTSARIRARATPSQYRLPIRGTSVAAVPSTSSAAAQVTSPESA